MGLGHEVLRAANARLVQVNLSGYPYDSPSARRPGQDIAAQAEGGMMSVTCEADRDPVRVGFAVVDAAASYAVAQATLAGVLRAARTGTGSLVDVSLLEVSVHLQSAMWGEWSLTGRPPSRQGNGQATVAPAADLVATSDGHVVVSAYIQEHFGRLCAVLGRPELAEDPRFAGNSARVSNRAALRAELSAGLGTLTSAAAVALLQRNGIVAGAVLDYEQVSRSPDVVASALLTPGVAEDGARFFFLRLPMRFDRRSGPVHDPVAPLGGWTAAAVGGPVVIDERIVGLGFDAYLDEVRRFTDEELILLEAGTAAAHSIPDGVVERMARLGLFGITLPREVGGLGWGVEQQVRLAFEFTRAACAFRSRFSTTIGLTSQLLLDHGSDEQRARYLPEMAAGRCVAAFALTEPEAGSDATALRTTARRTPDGRYRLDGHKRFITNGPWADLLVLFARTDDAPRGAAGMSGFLVDGNAPRVRRWSAPTMNGHEAAPVGEIVLTGVVAPAENLIGGVEGGGLTQALRGINHARMHVAATAVGQATRLLAEMGAHARTRRQFGAPLGDLGAVQEKLGHGYAELAAARALVLDCARRFDEAGHSAGTRIAGTDIAAAKYVAAAAKYVATEMVGRLADQAVQLVGGEAIAGDHCVGRLWHDVRALRIYEGASELHLRNLGRHVLKHV